jgi:hypothetical protein
MLYVFSNLSLIVSSTKIGRISVFSKMLKLLTFFCFSLGTLQASVLGSVIQNGDFEDQPNFGNGVINVGGASAFTGTQIPGWIIENGHAVTIHQTPNHSWISGNYSLNLDGEGYNGVNGNLYQDFNSNAVANYTIEYDYKGWLSNSATLTVSVTDTSTSIVVFTRTSPWQSFLVHETGSFQGTGNVLRLRISQTQTGTNDNSLIFDNLSVTSSAAVPEPTSMAIFGLGALSFAYRSRRKLMK